VADRGLRRDRRLAAGKWHWSRAGRIPFIAGARSRAVRLFPGYRALHRRFLFQSTRSWCLLNGCPCVHALPDRVRSLAPRRGRQDLTDSSYRIAQWQCDDGA